MKINNTFKARTACIGLVLLAAFSFAGCGSNGGAQDPATAAQAQEREKLQVENQALEQVRTENEEVQKLKKENEDLPKVRSQYQEAARLRKENEQLRQQAAKLSHSNAAPVTAQAAGAGVGAALAQLDKKEASQDEGTLNEGDDIYIEPKYLKTLLPDFDWDKLGRTDPIAVRSLLEKDGIPLTNVVQLKEFGLTNYVVRRAPIKLPATAQPNP